MNSSDKSSSSWLLPTLGFLVVATVALLCYVLKPGSKTGPGLPPGARGQTSRPPVTIKPETLTNLFGPASQPAGTPAPAISAELQRAIDAGLKALAAAQSTNGGYPLTSKDPTAKDLTGITALAGLAFLAHGDLPARGIYARNLQRIQEALMGSAQPSGYLARTNDTGGMYCHSLALEFLANLSLLTDDPATRQTCRKLAEKAVVLIVSAQSEEGGWRYTPMPSSADSCQTAGQLIALRAAADAGINVDKAVAEKATRYLLLLQEPDGGFRYTSGGGASGYARTAAVLATLHHAGLGQTEPARRGLEYLRPYFPESTGVPPRKIGSEFPYYGLYYAAQAMYLAGGDPWKSWYEANCADLVRKQDATGLWPDRQGDLLATSAALIVLQFPKKGLPVLTHETPPIGR
jgi:hypothetical protein